MNRAGDNVLVKVVVITVEILILNLLIFGLGSYYNYNLTSLPSDSMMSAFVNLIYIISVSLIGLVVDKRNSPIESILSRVFKTILLFCVVLIVVFASLHIKIKISFFVYLALLQFLCSGCWRLLFRYLLKVYRDRIGPYKKVMILGSGRVASEVYEHIVTNLNFGYKFCGCYDDLPSDQFKIDKDLVFGTLADAETKVKNHEVDEIICTLPAGDDRKALPIIKLAEKSLVRCFFVPDFKRYIRKSVSLFFVGNIPILRFRDEPLEDMLNRFIKRAFDLFVSSVFLVTIFLWLFLFVGIAIKLDSPGPIFFRQKRTGKNGDDFYCLKFRTMTVNDKADELQATKRDARVTKFGKFLRRTNLDEMPQFINAFLGDMSIVGPRPHMVKQTDTYSKLIEDYMVRHLVKPGITGWAQVTGFRGETSDISQMEGRVERDVWYIENWSFWLDIRIMWMTVYNMIKGDSAAY